jgi:LPS export ABC transporter protein LptC
MKTDDEAACRIAVPFSISFLVRSIIALMMATMLFACKNDIQTIRALEEVDTLPDLTARNIEILYSEKGHVEVKLQSPYLKSYGGKEPYSEFPEGFTVLFYDTNMQVKSRISANYGISYDKKKLMEARYNVVAENLETNEQLRTEQLFWDQIKETIYTDKFIRIIRGNDVNTGDGLVSDQRMENIVITNPRGPIEVRDDGERK